MRKLLVLPFLVPCIVLGQLPVDMAAQNKNVLLEEYTGLHCSFCPDGAKMADEIHDKNKDDVFIITWHIGSFAEPNVSEPDYRTIFGDSIEVESGVVGYPGGSINRHIFSGSQTNLSRYVWETYADQTRTQASYANIAMDADINLTTRVVTIDAEIYFTGNTAPATIYFNLAITQDNIIGPQNGKEKNPDYTMPNNEYRHMHMLRHLITEQWGDTLVGTSQSTLIAKQYQYIVPADINGVPVDLTNINFLGFIAEGKSEVITVEDAHITYSGVPVGVSLVDIAAKTKMATPSFCDPNVTPEVTIYNNSSTNIDSFEVSYSLNNGTPVVQLITTVLMADDSTTITFAPVVVTDEKNVIAFNVNVDDVSSLIDTSQNNQYSHSDAFFYMPPGTFGTGFIEDFESYNHGIEDPDNAFLITPPVGKQAYVVDNDNIGGVNTSLGGFWNSQQSYRWKLPFIPSGIESSLVYKKLDFSAASDATLVFSYAYSQNSSNSQDSLNIDVSTNCGNTWTNVYGGYGSSLATAPSHPGFFYPDSTEWKVEAVSLDAFNGESEIIMRFRVYSDDGASLFIDDIEVSASAYTWDCDPITGCYNPGNDSGAYSTLAACELACNVTGIGNNPEELFSVYPIPSDEYLFIDYFIHKKQSTILTIYNMMGEVILNKEFAQQMPGTYYTRINVSKYSKGIYILKLRTDNKTETKKILVN